MDLRNIPERHFGWVTRTAHLFAVVTAAFALSGVTAQANTSIFTNTGTICTGGAHCWQAGDFGVLLGTYNASTTTWQTASANDNNSTINGEIGIGHSSGITDTGNANKTWTGPIDFADALTGTASGVCGAGTCSVAPGTNLTNGGHKVTVTGGTVYDAAGEILTALEQMRQISAYYMSQTVPVANQKTTSLGASIGISSVHTGGLQMYSATNLSQGALTIFGNTQDLVVINISGTAIFTNTITLSGGITSDQILFNIVGVNATGDILTATTSGNTLNGIFWVANDTYNVSTNFGSSTTGQGARLLGSKGTDTWGANFVLTAPADTPMVPEPSTYFLMAAGLSTIFYIRQRRKQ